MTNERTGNGWATKKLDYVFGAALSVLIGLTGFLVNGQYEVAEQGRANKLAIEGINKTLSAEAMAKDARAAAERDQLQLEVLRLRQQREQDDRATEARVAAERGGGPKQ